MNKKEDPGKRTFKRITNSEIYEEVMSTKDHVIKLTEGIKFNRRWLYGVSVVLLAFVGWIFST